MAKKIGWDLGNMPQKIMALGTFHGTLLNKLHKDPVVVGRITQAGAKIISNYFDSYVDAIARMDNYRYHHIYEFGKTGSKSGRLFKATVKNGLISYSLLPASVSNQNGAVFQQKAFIMEAGTPIVIEPVSSDYLVYEIDGETIFSKRSVVNQPGGPYVANAFRDLFNEFFSSNLPNVALKELGFFDEIEKGLLTETRKVEPKISRGNITTSSTMAAQAAYGIADRVETRGNRL